MRAKIDPSKLSTLLPGGIIATIVILLVAGRMIWLSANRPAHREEITAAFGWARQFYGVPLLNHEGSQFLFTATSDKGFGLFQGDTVTGHIQTILDERGGGMFGSDHKYFGLAWSPDDRAFIYSAHDNRWTNDNLIICPADGHQASAQLTVGPNAVAELVWVNPAEFVYVGRDTGLVDVRKQADGQWQQHELFHGTGMSSLAAIDANTVAWLQDGVICHFDLTTDLTGASSLASAARPNASVTPPHQRLGALVGRCDLASSRPDAGVRVGRFECGQK